MITQLRGRLLEKHPPSLVLEAGSLGYEVYASMQTFYQLAEIGTEIFLYTHFLIRAEEQTLYGFLQREERVLFRELLKVTGIGPKAALAILSRVDTQQLILILTTQNTQALQRIPGIGRKTAERLLLEMADRLKHLSINQTDNLYKPSTGIPEKNTVQQNAISALISLGYKPQVALSAVNQIQQPELTLEELIRLALHNLH